MNVYYCNIYSHIIGMLNISPGQIDNPIIQFVSTEVLQ
jgi:hypothetical protein